MLAYAIVALVLCASGLGVWGLVLARYGGLLVELIVIWALVDWRPCRAAMSITMWRSLARYGRHVFAAAILSQSRTSVVTILLGRFVSIEAVGQLRYANTMATLPFEMWVFSSSYVVFPAFARIAHESERFKSAFLRTLRWAGIATFPASAILLPLGPPLVVCLLGERWREAGYAVMPLVGYPIVGALSSVLAEGVKGVGKPGVLSRSAVVSLSATILLTIAFLPLGIVGVTGAASVASLVTVVYMTRIALPVLEIDRVSVLRSLRPSFLATAFMVATLFPLEWLLVHADRHGTLVGMSLLVGEGAVGFLVYVGALRALDPEAVATLWRAVRALAERTRWRREAR